MNYDNNKKCGLFKFQSGCKKLYLNSPKGYSRKIINSQTDIIYACMCCTVVVNVTQTFTAGLLLDVCIWPPETADGR